MLEDNTIIKVMNRISGKVVYKIAEMGITRIFQPGETKGIEMRELRKLSWEPGGLELLKDSLLILDKEAISELIGETEPEYFYTEKEVTYLLEEGTLDQLEDCLNFCPESIKELIVDTAFKIELNDVRKRDMILNKTGFSITNMIDAKRAEEEYLKAEAKKEGIELNKKDENITRKSSPITEQNKTLNGRKAALPDYKVISKK